MQSTMSVFLPAIQKNLNLLISDAMIKPGKFVILPIQNSFSITDKFFKKYKISFICEVDDAYHLVNGKEFGYEMNEFTAVSKGLMIGAQFLLSAAVTALAPAVGNIINGSISGCLPKIGSEASSALLEKLEGPSSKGINSWKLSSSECSKLEKESCDALKEFVKKILEGKDTSKLGVAKANRSDGTVCWLCEQHYKDEIIGPKPSPAGDGKTNSPLSPLTNNDLISSVAKPVNVEPEFSVKSPKVITVFASEKTIDAAAQPVLCPLYDGTLFVLL
jgi:hypothetical protein